MELRHWAKWLKKRRRRVRSKFGEQHCPRGQWALELANGVCLQLMENECRPPWAHRRGVHAPSLASGMGKELSCCPAQSLKQTVSTVEPGPPVHVRVSRNVAVETTALGQSIDLLERKCTFRVLTHTKGVATLRLLQRGSRAAWRSWSPGSFCSLAHWRAVVTKVN